MMLQSHVAFSKDDNPSTTSGIWAVPAGHEGNLEMCDPAHPAEQIFHCSHAAEPGAGPGSGIDPQLSYVGHILQLGIGFRAHSLPAG